MFAGIGNESRRLASLSGAAGYSAEYAQEKNQGLSLFDAHLLYTMIRERKPKLMIEIGSGGSTKIALDALRRNREQGHPFHFIALGVYPSAELQSVADRDFELIAKKVQGVELSVFASADLLYIDSTHVSRIDSDVKYELLEIVPVLGPGTYIHWHDIPLPMNYCEGWTKSGRKSWNESFLLHAFLLYTKAGSICWVSNCMRMNPLNTLQFAFPFFDARHRISSFWLERTDVPRGDSTGGEYLDQVFPRTHHALEVESSRQFVCTRQRFGHDESEVLDLEGITSSWARSESCDNSVTLPSTETRSISTLDMILFAVRRTGRDQCQDDFDTSVGMPIVLMANSVSMSRRILASGLASARSAGLQDDTRSTPRRRQRLSDAGRKPLPSASSRSQVQ